MGRSLPGALAAGILGAGGAADQSDGMFTGLAPRFNGHIDEFGAAHVQPSDSFIATTWKAMSDSGAFAAPAVGGVARP
jgi:hypothetical protein